MDLLSGNVGVPGAQPQGQVSVPQPQSQPQVGGQMPVVGMDSEGYWTLNGERAMTQSQMNVKYGQKTAEIRDLRTQLEQSQQVAGSYLAELTTLRQRETARAEGVHDGAMEYALWGANKLAVNGKDFTTALKEFIQANPTVFGTPQSAMQQVTQPVQGVVQNPTQQSGAMQQQGQSTPTREQKTAYMQFYAPGAEHGAQQPQSSGQYAPQAAPATPTSQVPVSQPGYAGQYVSSGVSGFVGGPTTGMGDTETLKSVFAARRKEEIGG